MKLPEVAARLRELAVELNCSELSALANEIPRRTATVRAPKQSTPMTDEVRAEIRRMKKSNPALSQREIGEKLNINSGRVSETLRGKRK